MASVGAFTLGIWLAGSVGAIVASGSKSHSLSALSLAFKVIPWLPGPCVGRGANVAAYRGCMVSYSARRAMGDRASISVADGTNGGPGWAMVK